MTTRTEIERIAEHIEGISTFMRPEAVERMRKLSFYFKLRSPTEWDIDPDDEQGFSTRVVRKWCIFFAGQVVNKDSAAGSGCVLQTYAVSLGMHPWSLKPRDGWLFPVRPIRKGRLYISNNWPIPCQEPENNVGAPPAYVSLRPELVHLLGEDGYEALQAVTSGWLDPSPVRASAPTAHSYTVDASAAEQDECKPQ